MHHTRTANGACSTGGLIVWQTGLMVSLLVFVLVSVPISVLVSVVVSVPISLLVSVLVSVPISIQRSTQAIHAKFSDQPRLVRPVRVIFRVRVWGCGFLVFFWWGLYMYESLGYGLAWIGLSVLLDLSENLESSLT